MHIFGISNCTTVKRACAWFTLNKLEFTFHDYKKTGITVAQLSAWAEKIHWETLLNRRGLTWRNLPEDTKAGITDPTSAIALMALHPTLIKRPVVAYRDMLLVGFDETEYSTFLLNDTSI